MWLDEGGGGFTPISTNPPLYQEEVVSIKTTHSHKHINSLKPKLIKCHNFLKWALSSKQILTKHLPAITCHSAIFYR